MKRVYFLLVAIVAVLILPVSAALAGGGNPLAPACLVTHADIENAVQLQGVFAMDITHPNPGGVGTADVTLRLEKAGQNIDPVWFRTTHLSTFTDTTLLAHQHQLCEVLTALQASIRTAFGLHANTQFLFTKAGIRKAEIDVDPSTLAVPPPNQHAMTVFDVVIFGKK